MEIISRVTDTATSAVVIIVVVVVVVVVVIVSANRYVIIIGSVIFVPRKALASNEISRIKTAILRGMPLWEAGRTREGKRRELEQRRGIKLLAFSLYIYMFINVH